MLLTQAGPGQERQGVVTAGGRYTFCIGPDGTFDGLSVDLGDLHFPRDADVAADEAARFRAASPAERMRAIRSALNGGAFLIARSPQRAFIAAYRQRQEDLARDAIMRFLVRHAGNT